MTVLTYKIHMETPKNYHMVNITDQIDEKLRESGLEHGTITIFVPGSTAGLTTVEYEPGLVKDLEIFFEEIIPQKKYYHHHETWHDNNGHSHVRASLLGPSIVIPFVSGRMTLGTWQQIVLIDFDVPARSRKIIIQIMGE